MDDITCATGLNFVEHYLAVLLICQCRVYANSIDDLFLYGLIIQCLTDTFINSTKYFGFSLSSLS